MKTVTFRVATFDVDYDPETYDILVDDEIVIEGIRAKWIELENVDMEPLWDKIGIKLWWDDSILPPDPNAPIHEGEGRICNDCNRFIVAPKNTSVPVFNLLCTCKYRYAEDYKGIRPWDPYADERKH